MRANWIARTTRINTTTAVKIGANGSRKKAIALLVGTDGAGRTARAAGGTGAGSDVSSARLMSMGVPGCGLVLRYPYRAAS
ncbi:hypothetical protein GCM10009116_09180 [Brevundimonas basaltis]